MRPWPKAPRRCLLSNTFCSDVTVVARSVIFFCALSITASRACNCCKWSVVFLVEVFIDSPRFCVTASSRVFTVCCNCECEFCSQLPMASSRALSSAQPLLGCRVHGRRLLAQLQRDDGDDADRDDQGENDKKGFRHRLF